MAEIGDGGLDASRAIYSRGTGAASFSPASARLAKVLLVFIKTAQFCQ